MCRGELVKFKPWWLLSLLRCSLLIYVIMIMMVMIKIIYKDESHDADDRMMKCLKMVRESFKVQTIQACLSNASFIWSRLRFTNTPGGYRLASSLRRGAKNMWFFFAGEEGGRFMPYVVPFLPWSWFSGKWVYLVVPPIFVSFHLGA